MDCRRRSAVDDDRSRRWVVDDDRYPRRWAVDDDRSRIAFYQAQAKASLDRVDKNLDRIRKNLRSIRSMRMSSATIPVSSSSILSATSRHRKQFRSQPAVVDDYPLLELPLRWREPPTLQWRDPPPNPLFRNQPAGIERNSAPEIAEQSDPKGSFEPPSTSTATVVDDSHHGSFHDRRACTRLSSSKRSASREHSVLGPICSRSRRSDAEVVQRLNSLSDTQSQIHATRSCPTLLPPSDSSSSSVQLLNDDTQPTSTPQFAISTGSTWMTIAKPKSASRLSDPPIAYGYKYGSNIARFSEASSCCLSSTPFVPAQTEAELLLPDSHHLNAAGKEMDYIRLQQRLQALHIREGIFGNHSSSAGTDLILPHSSSTVRHSVLPNPVALGESRGPSSLVDYNLQCYYPMKTQSQSPTAYYSNALNLNKAINVTASQNGNAELYCTLGVPFVMTPTTGDRELWHKTVRDANVYAVISPQLEKNVIVFLVDMELTPEQFLGAISGCSLQVMESHQAGKRDTSGTAEAVISCFQKLGASFDMNKIHMTRGYKKNVISWNTIVGALLRIGENQDAQKVFDKMLNREIVSWNKLFDGIRMPMQPDVLVWEALLGTHKMHGNVELRGRIACYLFKGILKFIVQLQNISLTFKIFDPGGLLMITIPIPPPMTRLDGVELFDARGE